MNDLTRRQREVLEYIRQYIREQGYPPAVRDIARHFNLVSAAGVHKHIKALVRKNYLSKADFLSRSLRVMQGEAAPGGDGPGEAVELPLVGYVAAGQPIEAVAQSDETLAVPASLIGRITDAYILKVKGNSMIEECIQDGDYVVVEPRETAENGEAVVALIGGHEATLKRFYRENGRVRLQPANPDMQPILIDREELRVQGVVIGLWRPYR